MITRIAFLARQRCAVWLALFLMCGVGATPAAPRSGVVAVDREMCDAMHARNVLHPGAPVGCAQLRIVRFSYLHFDGAVRNDGEVMVMAAVAEHVQSIFDALLAQRFPIAGARLMDHYDGDDAASMRDNNTSAFNHRPITDGALPSLHAYGLAIDLNPVQNPYLKFEEPGKAVYSPPAGARYANRLPIRPGKPSRAGMAEQAVEVFAEHGFMIWGGNWDTPIDYQHFQVSRELAERMAKLPLAQARALFSAYVARYRACRKIHRDKDTVAAQAACAATGELPTR